MATRSKSKYQRLNVVITPNQELSNGKNKTPDNRDEEYYGPPTSEVETTNSGQSHMSSIGIGTFGMNTSKRGNTSAFAIVVRDKLFPKVKFIGGTNTSLEYSTEPTSICGFMRVHCNVALNHAYHWWEEHCTMVKMIHTECRNNKIKNIKHIFTGKLITCRVRMKTRETECY